MSRNKSTNTRSWPQGDVNVKGTFENGMERKRKMWFEEINGRLTDADRSEIWNVTRKKRSGGSRMRSTHGRQDCVAPVINLTPEMDVDVAKDVMDSSKLSSKKQMKLLPNAHIEKFLEGNSKSMTGVRKISIKPSTLSEARVHHNTSVSRFPGEDANVDFPDNAGPLYKRLLSAMIDENQDFDNLNDEKTDPSRMAEWETDSLAPVPDENLLLKELHLIGIYPELLPGLVEKEDDTNQVNETRQEVIYSKQKHQDEQPILPVHLASEPPKRPRGRPRTRHLKNPIPGKKETSKESIPKKKRGRKPKNQQMDKCQEVKIHGTKSISVTPSTPNVSAQELKSASPCPSAENIITELDSTKVLDMIDFSNDPLEDLSLMLNLDDFDDLPLHNGDDDDDFSCLDIPMDDIWSLNLNF